MSKRLSELFQIFHKKKSWGDVSNRAILFDMDGTLLSGTKAAICRCVEVWFKQHGFPSPSDRAILNEIHKADLKSVLSTLLSSSNHPVDNVIKLAVKGIDCSYTQYFMPKYATLVKGAFEVIRWLQVRGFKVAIITNASKSMLQRFVQSFGFGNLINIAISADDVSKPKPSPDGIFKALDFLGAELEQAAMVGDTVTDIQAGLNAGTFTIGVLTGIGSREELQGAGASYVVPSVASLPELIRYKLRVF